MKLNEFLEFNPVEYISKGALAPKIPMDYLYPYSRKPTGYIFSPYNGGAKFRNGDTLFASITPCLENGKTAYVSILPEGEVAFGSTEYLVLRAIEGVSLPLFVYYLSVSNLIRVPAIMSMIGSSGRQRVQLNAIAKLDIPEFSLAKQQHIVNILGSIDDKIENNEEIIKSSLEYLQLSYQKHFGNMYRFSEIVPASFFIESSISGDWGDDKWTEQKQNKVVCIRGADISDIANGGKGKPPTRYIAAKKLKLKQLRANDIVVEISGGSPTQSTGRSLLITSQLIELYDTPIICTNFCRAIRCKNEVYSHFLYSSILFWYKKNSFFSYENGTTGIKNLDLESIFQSEELPLPDEKTLYDFYRVSARVFEILTELRKQNEILSELKQGYLKKFFG